jgi:TolA-binding protein
LATLGFASTGCVSHWRGQEIESDLRANQTQIDQINDSNRRAREKTSRDLAALDARFGDLERTLKGAVERLQTGSADNMLIIEKLRGELNAAQGKLAEVQHKLATEEATTQVGVVADPTAPPLPSDPVALYRYGWEKRQGSDCTEANRAFSAYVQKFPTNAKADNALFLIAECLYQGKANSQSIRTLRTIMQKYPKGDKVDDALELMHDNFVAMGKCKDALPFLETLVADYPKSPRIREARRKLKKTRRTCK